MCKNIVQFYVWKIFTSHLPSYGNTNQVNSGIDLFKHIPNYLKLITFDLEFERKKKKKAKDDQQYSTKFVLQNKRLK